MMIKFKRFQVWCHYSREHAKQVAELSGIHWIGILCDMFYLFLKFGIGSNVYLQYKMWELPKDRRLSIGKEVHNERKKVEAWWIDYFENIRFLNKWSSAKWNESPTKYKKRENAYRKRYNIGEGLTLEENVSIRRYHGLEGSLKIGKNVCLAKNTGIDYAGFVEIGDNVQLTNGVIILSHHHINHSDYTVEDKKENIIQSHVKISDGVLIGSRAIILSTCHYIGKYARVAAGSVVTKDVPDYAIVAGCPAKVIRIMPH